MNKIKGLTLLALSFLLPSCTIFSFGSGSSNSISSDESSSESSISSTPSSESSSLSSSSSESSNSSHESETYDPTKYYDGYYKTLVSWENGEDLKQKLHDIISGGNYKPLPYSPSVGNNWESLSAADQDLYDHEFVDAVYSGTNVLKTNTNAGWQREHAFCATLMCGQNTGDAVKTLGRATDWHNLFAASASGNTSRGNKNYGIADKTDNSYTNKTTANGNDGYSYDSKNFEPGDKDKGRLSRAIFYMATMYKDDIKDTDGNVTLPGLKVVEEYINYVNTEENPYTSYAIGNLSTLLDWSKLSVDILEYQHNESVYSYTPSMFANSSTHNHPQGNRNPYVDYPQLVDYVFGDKKDEAGKLQNIKPSSIDLEIDAEGVRHYAIKEAKRDYGTDETFSSKDISVVAVDHSLKETPYSSFTIDGAKEGEVFSTSGNHEITVITPINDLKYTVIVEDDPVESSLYNHELKKSDLGACSSGVVNTVTLSGVSWNVYWAKNSIANNNSKGTTFGAASSKTNGPVESLYFETSDAFDYNGKNSITGIYLRGSAASKCEYQTKISIGDTIVYSGLLGYKDVNTPVTIGTDSINSLNGAVKIEITNISAAVYIKNIAIDAI